MYSCTVVFFYLCVHNEFISVYSFEFISVFALASGGDMKVASGINIIFQYVKSAIVPSHYACNGSVGRNILLYILYSYPIRDVLVLAHELRMERLRN